MTKKHGLKKAHEYRMKHALAEAHGLISILKAIQDKQRPIDAMAEARGVLAKLTQSFHEASAYHSAYLNVLKEDEFLPLGREKEKRYRRRGVLTQQAATQ